MILLLDNYDSFVHNVARTIRLAGKATRVIRSDQITAEECRRLGPEAIILSPGPNRPEQAGCCLDVVRELAGEIPLLGICLGHQTIAVAYGAEVVTGPPRHGMASRIDHDGTGVFAGLPNRFAVGRYHSLRVAPETLTGSLQVTAWTMDSDSPDRCLMGISDHSRCVHGMQFHPESLLTEHGQTLIENFFALVNRHHARATKVDSASNGRGGPVVWSPKRFEVPSSRVTLSCDTSPRVASVASNEGSPWMAGSWSDQQESRLRTTESAVKRMAKRWSVYQAVPFPMISIARGASAESRHRLRDTNAYDEETST